MDDKRRNSVIEALIFAAAEPITLKDIQSICGDCDAASVDAVITHLNTSYAKEHRAFHIVGLANGWQMVTKEEYAEELKQLYDHRIKTRLSKPALETLAIVAYKQPITKAEIEQIRGVNADNMLKTLLNRELVRITGRKDVPGRPIIYETTDKFLQYFGLESLKDLPKLEDFIKNNEIAADGSPLDKGESYGYQGTEGEDQRHRSENPNVVEPETTSC